MKGVERFGRHRAALASPSTGGRQREAKGSSVLAGTVALLLDDMAPWGAAAFMSWGSGPPR